ncbi:diphthamide synthesis protein [Candidatus Woesearchaeota archaeon]|nr:diphthamide synthesis protein [Candidatus Woesearchaeota archaeon]
MQYDLELDAAVDKIKSENASLVCIQLPSGLRPKAAEIQRYLESRTGARILIWAGTCFGACDVPLHIEKLGVDLIIHWGHSKWR